MYSNYPPTHSLLKSGVHKQRLHNVKLGSSTPAYRPVGPMADAAGHSIRFANHKSMVPSRAEQLGMTEAEYERYVAARKESLGACEEYLAFYTHLANAPVSV